MEVRILKNGERTRCKWFGPLSSTRLSTIFAVSLAICHLSAKPASARSASTSALLLRGYSTHKIKTHARWASEQTFIKFYKKEIAIAATKTSEPLANFTRRYLSHALRVKVIRRSEREHAEKMLANFIAVMEMPIHILQRNSNSLYSKQSIADFYGITKYGVKRLANEVVRVDFPNIRFSVRGNQRRSAR
jgi:hypothetical protein